MFYVAKVLQALGLADVGYAVYLGIVQGIAMAEEIISDARRRCRFQFGPHARKQGRLRGESNGCSRLRPE